MAGTRLAGGVAGSWPVAAPLLCAVHCLSAPALVLVAPTLARSRLVEGLIMVLALGVVMPMAIRAYRSHGSVLPGVPLVAGIGLWGVEFAHLHLPFPAAALTVAGSLFLAGGLLWGEHLRRSAGRGCDCPVHLGQA
jgi:hypothetical protein